MQDMKLTKKEAKKQYGGMVEEVATESRPKYPWGLEINLEEESLKKLDMKVEDYSVNDKLKFECEAYVTTIGEYRLNLQVRKMEIL